MKAQINKIRGLEDDKKAVPFAELEKLDSLLATCIAMYQIIAKFIDKAEYESCQNHFGAIVDGMTDFVQNISSNRQGTKFQFYADLMSLIYNRACCLSIEANHFCFTKEFKKAIDAYQASAGLYTEVLSLVTQVFEEFKEKGLAKILGPDLAQKNLELLHNLMLAQAQELLYQTRERSQGLEQDDIGILHQTAIFYQNAYQAGQTLGKKVKKYNDYVQPGAKVAFLDELYYHWQLAKLQLFQANSVFLFNKQSQSELKDFAQFYRLGLMAQDLIKQVYYECTICQRVRDNGACKPKSSYDFIKGNQDITSKIEQVKQNKVELAESV